jgi:3-oxoacyl-(acyl-carrier-protein) synthase
MSIQGLCQTVIGTRTAGLDALILAFHRIRSGVWTRAVVCAADEYAPIINRAHAHFGLHRTDAISRTSRKSPGFVSGCGAVAMILESPDSARSRHVNSRGILGATAGAFVPDLQSRRGVAAVQRVVTELESPRHFVCSANATWLDRIELAGVVAADLANRNENSCGSIVGAAYGHTAECFSATPLVGMAAVLIGGKLPAWRAGWSGIARVAKGDEHVDSFGVLATDYSGAISGCRIHEVRPR